MIQKKSTRRARHAAEESGVIKETIRKSKLTASNEFELKKLIFFLIIVIIVGAIIIMFLYRRNKYKDLCAYTEKLLEIEWNDCIESAAGDVELDMGEEYARIRLEIKAGYEEEALSIVQSRFVKPLDLSRFTAVLNYRHEFATELKNSDIQYVYETVMMGKKYVLEI